MRARVSQRARKREVSSDAHVYERVFEKNSKLNETRRFSVSFKHSLKLHGEQIFRFRSRAMRARVSQRARKREVSGGAHVYERVFEKNSKLNEPRRFSGSFKHSP